GSAVGCAVTSAADVAAVVAATGGGGSVLEDDACSCRSHPSARSTRNATPPAWSAAGRFACPPLTAWNTLSEGSAILPLSLLARRSLFLPSYSVASPDRSIHAGPHSKRSTSRSLFGDCRLRGPFDSFAGVPGRHRLHRAFPPGPSLRRDHRGDRGRDRPP